MNDDERIAVDRIDTYPFPSTILDATLWLQTLKALEDHQISIWQVAPWVADVQSGGTKCEYVDKVTDGDA